MSHDGILDPDGNPLNYAWVWAHRERTETSARIDTGDESKPPDGSFSISVPPGTYEVGAGAPEDWGYIHPDFQEVTVDASTPADVTLQFRASDATITGRVCYHDEAGNKVYGPWVWGWSERGAHTGAPTDGEGNYRLNVTTGTTWHLGASYQYDDSTFYDTTTDYTVEMTGDSATQNMEIFPNTAELPDAESESFDATNPLVITLADGTEINIPAGAIATSGTVKVVVTPVVEELQNTLTARPFGFGYAMYAFDGDDNQITGTFNRNVTLSFYYTDDELQRRGVNEDDLSPAYFSTTTNSWTKVESYSVDREANRLTVQINHFSTWALTAPASTSEPEPEPTPPENLVAKASFEERGRIPRPWRGKNLTRKDKRVCDTAHDGSCSFMMLGTTAKKLLRQVVRVSGSAGDTFTLSGWSRATKPLRKGGAYCLQAKVFHTDGTKKNYRICFAKRTHRWQRRRKSFTIAKEYSKIVVYLRYAKQGGTAWFDDVRLIKN